MLISWLVPFKCVGHGYMTVEGSIAIGKPPDHFHNHTEVV